MGSRYVLRERLGIGGMGVVYRAARRDGSADRAIKLLRSELAEDPVIRDRFIQESNLMRAMRSPNLVAVEDLIVDGDDIAIVMELVAGGTLRDHMESKGQLSPDDALEVIRQVLLGLTKVHAVGIVHRDLKPENVLLVGAPGDNGFLAKVSDFGIARLVDGPRLTGTNVFIGTPHYSAPELIEGSLPSTSADIYAAGVVLYELISGSTPFAETAGYALMHRQLNTPPPRSPMINDQVWSLLEGWLAIEAAIRPRNATEALEELDALMTEGTVPTRVKDGVATNAGREPSVPVVVPPPSPPVGSMPGQGAVQVVRQTAAVSDPDVIDLAQLERQQADATRVRPAEPLIPFEQPPSPPVIVGPPTNWDDGQPQVKAFGAGSYGFPEPPTAKSEKPNRRRNLLITLATIVVVAIAAVGTAFALSGGGGTKTYALKFTPETYPQSGITVDRIWTLTGGKQPNLHGELTFHTTKTTDTTINEVLPKSLALSTDDVKFTPQPKIIVSDPEVGYLIQAGPDQTVTASYDVAVPSDEVSMGVLTSWAQGQREEAASYYNRANPLKTLVVSPKLLKLQVGAPRKHFTLSGTLENGQKASNVAFGGATYTVTTQDVADVSRTGLATGLKQGTTTVKIQVAKASVTAKITVAAAPKHAAVADGLPQSPQSGPTTETTCAPGHPGTPTSVHATLDSNASITVSWRAPASSLPCVHVIGYRVTESGPGGTPTQTPGPDAESVTFTGLTPGTYSYTVVAVGNTNEGDAGHSNGVTIIAPKCSLPPGSAQAALTGQTISVAWTAPVSTDTCPNVTSALTGYTVNVSGPTQLPETTQAETAQFTDLAPGSYTFHVIANYSGQPSSGATTANPTSIVVGVPPCSAVPPAPTGVVATGAVGKASVTWTNVVAPPNCKVSYAVTAPAVAQQGAPNPAVFSSLTPGTYTFTVIAIDAAGASGPASSMPVIVSGPCDPASLLPPANVVAGTEAASANVTIRWSAPLVAAGCPTPTYEVAVSPPTAQPPSPIAGTAASISVADGLEHLVTVTADYGPGLPARTAQGSFMADATCPDGTIAATLLACPPTQPVGKLPPAG